MKYSILAVLSALLLLSGCSVLKKGSTNDTSKTRREIERRVVYRPGDTIVNETKYNVRYKDTTITRYNYETKTTLREIYDEEGNRRTECIPSAIREEFENIKEDIHNDIQTLKETQHSFDPTPFIWALVGLAGMMVLIAGIGLYSITSLKKALPDIVKSIIDQNNT